ncbi:MAG TPA: LLM class F420-dependent oxidoreductase [Candidatus Tectomicrobia bacterium]
MNIGISLFSGRQPVDVAVVAQKAEALGFDSLWLGEHPVIPVHSSSPAPGSSGGSIPAFYSQLVDPFVALARASAVTTTLKLGTGITLVPERNPLLLAKEVATLDYYSKGRFLFGIGAGWNKEETEIMGGNFTHRWTQTREAIEAMKALWANEVAEYHGTYYDFPLVRSFPRPVQQPHPPIFLGGVAQQVFKRIVAYGNGWMPTRSTPELIRQGRAVLNELAVEAGRDPRSIAVMAYIAPTDRAVLEALEEAGADAAVVRLESESDAAVPAALEQIAQQVL